MRHIKQWNNCKKCAPIICENIWEANRKYENYNIDGQHFTINPFCISKKFVVTFPYCTSRLGSLLEAFDYVISVYEDIQLQDYLNILKYRSIQENFINEKEKLNENN